MKITQNNVAISVYTGAELDQFNVPDRSRYLPVWSSAHAEFVYVTTHVTKDDLARFCGLHTWDCAIPQPVYDERTHSAAQLERLNQCIWLYDNAPIFGELFNVVNEFQRQVNEVIERDHAQYSVYLVGADESRGYIHESAALKSFDGFAHYRQVQLWHGDVLLKESAPVSNDHVSENYTLRTIYLKHGHYAIRLYHYDTLLFDTTLNLSRMYTDAFTAAKHAFDFLSDDAYITEQKALYPERAEALENWRIHVMNGAFDYFRE